jgi:hypothetical protein
MIKPTYLETVSDAFKKHHILFFAIVVILLHLIDGFLRNYSINIYQGSIILTAYIFINSKLSLYTTFMGGIISTIIPFILYKFFKRFAKNVNVFNIGLLSFFSVLFFMAIFECVSIVGLAYSLTAFDVLPKSIFQYLISYIVACFLIVFISATLLYLTKFINKKNKFIDSITPTKFTQLEENLGFLNF